MVKGDLFIVSAPSGAGKTTLLKLLFKELDNLGFSVSHTTRAPRQGEVDGLDYYFVTDQEFSEMVERDLFLEWAWVHNHRYGTSKKEVDRLLSKGKDVILDIDVQGALNVKKKIPQAVLVFILPPSIEELERRLRTRGTESEEEIALRLKNAKDEIKEVKNYEFVVVNADLKEAMLRLKSIIISFRQRKERVLANRELCKALGLDS